MSPAIFSDDHMSNDPVNRTSWFSPGSRWATTPVLLTLATVIALISLFLHTIIEPKGLGSEAVIGYVPVLLGCVSMWLCVRARRNTKHKGLVLSYTLFLAPFAFSYPAWIVFLWLTYASGKYSGPMP
jgi:hypothetical protein